MTKPWATKVRSERRTNGEDSKGVVNEVSEKPGNMRSLKPNQECHLRREAFFKEVE